MTAAKKPTTKRKVSKKKTKKKVVKKKTGPAVKRKVKSYERKHKHGVERRDITRAAIKVLAAGMRQTFDINKSGLYALGVMKTKRGQPAFIAQQEANDIVEEILYQYERLMKHLKTNVEK